MNCFLSPYRIYLGLTAFFMFFILLILLILSNNFFAYFEIFLDKIYMIYKILYVFSSCLIVSVFFLSRNLRGLRGKTPIQVNHHKDTKHTKKCCKSAKNYELFSFSLIEKTHKNSSTPKNRLFKSYVMRHYLCGGELVPGSIVSPPRQEFN